MPPSKVYKTVSAMTMTTANFSEVPSTTLTTKAMAETRTPSAIARVIKKVLAAIARIFWPNRFSINA